MPESRTRRARWAVVGPACNAGRGERIARGFVALFLAAFAISTAESAMIVAVVAGLLAIGVGMMAVTGFCPDDWLRLRTVRSYGENSAGYEDLSHVLEFDDKPDSAQPHDRGERRGR